MKTIISILLILYSTSLFACNQITPKSLITKIPKVSFFTGLKNKPASMKHIPGDDYELSEINRRIFVKIRFIVADQLNIPLDPKNPTALDQITPKTHLARDLGATSIDLIEIGIYIQKVFDVPFPDYEKLHTMEDYIKHIRRHSYTF